MPSEALARERRIEQSLNIEADGPRGRMSEIPHQNESPNPIPIRGPVDRQNDADQARADRVHVDDKRAFGHAGRLALFPDAFALRPNLIEENWLLWQ